MLPAATAGMLAGNALPALGAAVLWGGGDFAGGTAVRRAGGSAAAAARVVLVGHVASLLVLGAMLAATHAALHAGAATAWALGSGVVACLGLVGFYAALSRGAMGANAAISGVLAAAVPAAVSAVLEGSPGPLRLTGFLLAFAAIFLIALAPAATAQPGGRLTSTLAIGSGLLFGLYFAGLRFAAPAGELQAMTLARCGSAAAALVLVLATWQRKGALRQPRSVLPHGVLSSRVLLLALLGSAFDTGANLLYILAVHTGRLDVAAVLASLYPAPTIVLAAVLLRERLSRRQWLGMALGGAAVVLVAI